MKKILFTVAIAIAASTVSLYASSGNTAGSQTQCSKCASGACTKGSCPDKPGCICH